MTRLERRIECVEMAIASAQSHLSTIKENPSISSLACLFAASKQIQKETGDLQRVLHKMWRANPKEVVR